MSKVSWSPRNIYLYLVCLITLVMVIFSTVNLVKALVDLAYPERQARVEVPLRVVPAWPEPPEMDQRQLEEQREVQRQWALRRSVLISLASSAAMFLIAGPLYVYHWRKIESGARGGTISSESR